MEILVRTQLKFTYEFIINYVEYINMKRGILSTLFKVQFRFYICIYQRKTVLMAQSNCKIFHAHLLCLYIN